MKTIPQQKKTYLDEFSITILSRLKKEHIENQNIDNGIDDESVTTIPIENIKSQYEYHYDENDEIDSIIYYKDNWKIEVSGKIWNEISKCINDLYRLKWIKNCIAFQTLLKTVLSWFFDVIERNQICVSFSQYVEDEIKSMQKKYILYFPIPYVIAKTSFKIANVSFDLISDNELDKIMLSSKDKDFYHNKMFASISLSGEKEHIVKLAYEQCSLAVDAIKICSRLSFDPSFSGVCLDLEKNIRLHELNRCIIKDASSQESISEELNVGIHSWSIDKKFVKDLEEHQINLYSEFINRLIDQEASELELVLISSIKTYSKSLSIQNKYEKIVLLCSIMDSLMLKDNEVSIKDTLRKYIPIIITNDTKRREQIKKHLNNMYEIRSQYIHHMCEKKLLVKDVYGLYGIVSTLLLVLINNSMRYKSMKEIIGMIDKKIDDVIIDESKLNLFI